MDPPGRGDSRVLKSGVIVVQPQVETPRISPDPSAGPFVDKVRVTMSCATPRSAIYYTTDGSDAVTSDTRSLYDGPFFMYGLYPESNSVKAVAEAAHMSPSPEASATFVVKKQACTPSIDLQQGAYIVGRPVTIACHGGESADVYYSILSDGESADDGGHSKGTLYQGPFQLQDEGNVTIAAIAMADSLVSSPPVVSPQVTIEPEPTCAANEYEHGAGVDSSSSAIVSWDAADRLCRACPAGGASVPGSKGIMSCRAKEGYVGPAGGPFRACEVGTYRSEGHSDCRKCPRFSTTRQAGAPSRQACISQPGYEAQGPATAEIFVACPIGWFSTGVGEKCQKCPEGGTTRKEASIGYGMCLAEPGYTNRHGWPNGPFDICGVGMYKSTVGPHPCKLCPFCSTTETIGATSVKMCVADIGCEGKGFGWGIGFTKCKNGSFKKSKGNGDCKPCDPGQTEGCGGVFPPPGQLPPVESR